ncbi:MAG: glycogen debranching N-terminal domain-containing protein [Nocardioides sp.]
MTRAWRREQPWLHDLEVSVHGNITCLSDVGGDLHRPGTGLYVDDRRVVSQSRLSCDGATPTTVSSSSVGGRTEVVAVPRELGDAGSDPTVELRRSRQLRDGGQQEVVCLTSRAAAEVVTTVRLTLGGDGADLAGVKGGDRPGPLLPADTGPDPHSLSWSDERHRTTVRISGGTAAPLRDGGVEVTWRVRVAPGTAQELTIEVDVDRLARTPFDAEPAVTRIDWSEVTVHAQDTRIDKMVSTSVTDLRGLLLSDPDDPGDVFAAAGTPWFLTLFGRDALWAARMTLPFGTDLAAGTLRTLARRQGRVTDPGNAEEPGKILHEVRRTGFADPSSTLHLPPVYFGTVDATPLWISLLHDAWRWGMPAAQVAALRPHLVGALGWLRRSVDNSRDGLIRYVDESGTGLANQGWKDSGDAMRHRDGAVARAPIALVETQAYAVQAALGAAHLGEALFDEPGDDLRAWGAALADRVRAHFWVADDAGPYLAMALDRDGAPVDGVGSNMGHVLGTGLLDEAESALVAARLTSPDLLGPFGISTLGHSNPAFNPIGYHTGSVWSHDTAICALGLAADGHREEAAAVLRGLVDAASRFDYRLPELFGGVGTSRPVPYPASCRPQAWASASAGAMVTAILGLRADAPIGRLRLAPMRPSPFGAVTVRGIRVRGDVCEVDVDAVGDVTDVRAPDWLSVDVESAH